MGETRHGLPPAKGGEVERWRGEALVKRMKGRLAGSR